MMDLALFDLDNTLIAGDSDFEWAQFLIAKGILDRALYEARNIEFYEQYKAGTLDIDVFLDFQLQPLSRFPRAPLRPRWQREARRWCDVGMFRATRAQEGLRRFRRTHLLVPKEPDLPVRPLRVAPPDAVARTLRLLPRRQAK